jgi:phosphoribosylformylglycinamidine synthase subunit PurL
VARHATIALKREGDVLVLIGSGEGWLGQSAYLSVIAGREEGAPPPVDLALERRNGDFVRTLIQSGTVDTVHDLSDGGLAVALAEMAMAGGIGAALPEVPVDLAPHAYLFGEDQGRYLMAVDPEAASDLLYSASAQGIDAAVVGVTGSDRLTLPGGETISLAELAAAHEGWLPAYMATQPAAPAS